jgi:hypothetical protein
MFQNNLQRCKFHTLEEIDEIIEKAKNPKPKRRVKVPTPEVDTQPAW